MFGETDKGLASTDRSGNGGKKKDVTSTEKQIFENSRRA
jgi:hypothetical protein